VATFYENTYASKVMSNERREPNPLAALSINRDKLHVEPIDRGHSGVHRNIARSQNSAARATEAAVRDGVFESPR